MPQVQILSPRPILTVRRKFYVREQTPLTHTAWHGKRTSRDSSPREICRYRLSAKTSPLQGEETVSTTVTCSTCCCGGTGIRERYIKKAGGITWRIFTKLPMTSIRRCIQGRRSKLSQYVSQSIVERAKKKGQKIDLCIAQ